MAKKVVKARVLSSAKKTKVSTSKTTATKPERLPAGAPSKPRYEPSHFVWLRPWRGEPRQPALVLYEENIQGVIVLYVTPKTNGDTGRREVPVMEIEGFVQ